MQFFAVLVCSSWILKLSGTSLVRGPSIKGNMTETGQDPKALSITGLFFIKKYPGLAGSKIKSMHLSWKFYFYPERGISCFQKKKLSELAPGLSSNYPQNLSWIFPVLPYHSLGSVINHIPLHPFAIKSHPNLISIPPKPSTIVSDISDISRRSITPSHCHIIIPSSLFFTVSFRHYRPSLFRISSAPIKFQASFSVMWLDDQHSTFLHSCGEQLLYCSSEIMTSFLVISYSWVQYLFISIFLYIRNSCTSAKLQFVID